MSLICKIRYLSPFCTMTCKEKKKKTAQKTKDGTQQSLVSQGEDLGSKTLSNSSHKLNISPSQVHLIRCDICDKQNSSNWVFL